MVVRLTI
jgi:hypothetical protein